MGQHPARAASLAARTRVALSEHEATFPLRQEQPHRGTPPAIALATAAMTAAATAVAAVAAVTVVVAGMGQRQQRGVQLQGNDLSRPRDGELKLQAATATMMRTTRSRRRVISGE